MNTSFLKYAAIVVISLAIGGVAGVYVSHLELVPEVVVLNSDLAGLQQEKAKLDDQLNRLAQENEGLRAEQVELLAELRDLKQRPAPQPAEQASGDPAVEPNLPADQLEADAPQSRVRAPQTGGPENDQTEAESQWSPEQRAERFREFEQRARERVGDVLNQEYANAPDRATQERIEALNAYVEQMAQLRDAMRDAETDEERDVLRQTMRESFDNVRQIVQTQQDSMLRDLAANNGITDAAKQDAFVAGLRDLQASPFFQADRMMGGGPMPFGGRGDGRWDGGWGGGRDGRGGRR